MPRHNYRMPEINTIRAQEFVFVCFQAAPLKIEEIEKKINQEFQNGLRI